MPSDLCQLAVPAYLFLRRTHFCVEAWRPGPAINRTQFCGRRGSLSIANRTRFCVKSLRRLSGLSTKFSLYISIA
ncbi:hypothetical protein CT19431_MP70056 [Cupriavidus taiwanensis]|nr:hypothetical protein CT19431_MP70056 [Cupriavidus taiwanensis]